MVSTFYPPYNFGGDGIYIHRLSNELARRGHHVDVVHCEDAYSVMQPGGVNGTYANHPNVNVHRLKSPASFMSPLLTQQTGTAVFKRKKLKRLLEEGEYDVIHFHNMSLIGIDSGLDIPMRHIPYFLPRIEEEVETETALDPSNNGNSDRPFFLFVGRLEKIKGVQNLIPVARKRPDYDLVIAGDGEYRQSLEDLASGAKNIKFLGRVDQRQLRELYRRAIAVVVPSICYETFGIIIIEAFSVKTPVIVNNLGALPEVVEDSGGGLVYSGLDELAAAMDRLASEPGLRGRLGISGHDAYLKYWTEDAHMAQYMGLVREMQKKRGANNAHQN